MTYLAATIVVLSGLAGIALTLLVMPGIWFMIGVAVAIAVFWQREMFSPWTLAAAVALALIAEIVELVASAAGSKRAGGTRPGAILSIVGGIVGAIVGTPLIPIPVIGTIAGAVIGAGLGAFIGERGLAARGWKDSARSAGGAAAGRLVATIVKTAFAAAIALLLSVAAFWP